jgi:serine/threonine-protein phosphatase with EF-hand domain
MGKKPRKSRVYSEAPPEVKQKNKAQEDDDDGPPMTAMLSESKVQALKRQFKRVDTNNDGKLSFDELSVILRAGNPQISEEDMKILFKGCDSDNSGFVSFEEFVDYVYAKSRLSKNDVLDQNPTRGWLDADEIRFARLKGSDSKVNKDDATYIGSLPRLWKEVPVKRPGEHKGARKSILQVGEGQLSPREEQQLDEAPGIEKAAVTMQKAFRGFQARTEVRKSRTWQIYQAVEYQVENNQTGMQDFLKRLVEVLPDAAENEADGNVNTQFDTLISKGWPGNISIPAAYKGCTLPEELTIDAVIEVLQYFGQQMHEPNKFPSLHFKYVFQLLVACRRKLKSMPSVVHISTKDSRVVTVIGDLHGQLRDLLEIFKMNGAPSADNPYLFNGDLVDRGPQSLEVALVVFGMLAADPHAVHVNRGNHEDITICRSYGFVDEISGKYKKDKTEKKQANLIATLFGEVFSMLPLAHVIDDDVLVLHGGISNKMRMVDVEKLERHKFKSVSDGVPAGESAANFELVSDILWSDPIDKSDDGVPFKGCEENDTRGAGKFWGTDVSKAWLKYHQYSLMIRSHECVDEGFEIKHHGRVLTLFSASNYYEDGSNVGCFCVIHRDRGAHLQQYVTSDKQIGKKGETLQFAKSVSKMEDGAVDQLRHVILARKPALFAKFQERDPNDTGKVLAQVWADTVQEVTDVFVPWITMRDGLVQSAEDGTVLWKTCLEARALPSQNSGIAAGLYTNLRQMEAVFRMIDSDGSGTITVPELEKAAHILNKARGAASSVSDTEVKKILGTMDVDGDGVISLNEFLEAMRNHELA